METVGTEMTNYMIGQFFSSDRGNYGDLLYYVIFNKLMERYGYNQEISAYGFLEGKAPCDAGYNVKGINRVLRYKEDKLTHLVVGGGDILRTDSLMLASHYATIVANNSVSSLGHNFISKIKKKLFGITDNIDKVFIDKYMNYGAIAPFLIDKNNYPNVGSLIYFSAGVPFGFNENEKISVKNAIESAEYIYLRDEQSKNKLVEAGITKHLDVAPDAVVVLSDFFDINLESERGKKLLSQHGLSVDKEFICVQSTYQQPIAEDELVNTLIEMKSITGKNIVLMPIGFCHDDDIYLKRVADRTNGACHYVEARSIYDMIALIAASSLFIGTSMHGNITAFSFGVPHLFGPIAVDKAEGFLDVVGLGRDCKLASWSESLDKLVKFENLSVDYFETLTSRAKSKVYNTFEKIYAILAEPRY